MNVHPVGWADEVLDSRLPYWRFANVVERARREVVRTLPEHLRDIHVYALSAEAEFHERWSEFYPPDGPIIVHQLAFEAMPDRENYYRQIKACLVHEYGHAVGDDHGEPELFRAASK